LNPLFVVNKVHVGGATPSRLILPIDNTNTSISTYELQKVSVYPNPSSGIFNVQSAEKFLEVKLMDLSGKFLELKYDNLGSFDISEFQKGVYILLIKTEKGIISKKIIKQ